jgi:hypothetical protein
MSMALVGAGLLVVVGGVLFYAFVWRGRSRRAEEVDDDVEPEQQQHRPLSDLQGHGRSLNIPQALQRRGKKRVHFADEGGYDLRMKEDDRVESSGPSAPAAEAEAVPFGPSFDFDDVPQIRIDETLTLAGAA